MYLAHYGLKQLPFRNTPDPAFFFETARHNEALANLVYAVEQRRGFVLLSGEIGSGKTLVTHLLLRHLEDRAQIALVRNTHLNSAQLIRLICDEFSIRVSEHADKAAMLLAINQFLIQQLAEDRLVVVIIDEAQNLSDKVLEELRMLSNLETSSEKLLQIVLVGQPELREKVSQPHLEQLRQRIALSYHLEPLTQEEVGAYIEHRLKVAHGKGRGHKQTDRDTTGEEVRFTPEAIAKIARFSRGTPRIINGLCDNALLYGYTAKTQVIDESLIEKVLKQSMHLAPRGQATVRARLNSLSATTGTEAASTTPPSVEQQEAHMSEEKMQTPTPTEQPAEEDKKKADAGNSAESSNPESWNIPFPGLHQSA